MLTDPSERALSQVMHKLKYARVPSTGGKRELSMDDTVERLMKFFKERFEHPKIHERLEEIRPLITALDVMPSMRLLASAGPAVQRENLCAFNCMYIPLDNWAQFGTLAYALMCGTGVGFSVRKVHTRLLWVEPVEQPSTLVIRVDDTRDSWAASIQRLIVAFSRGNLDAIFDTSRVRPKGTPLKITGGTASGPGVLHTLERNLRAMFCRIFTKNSTGHPLAPIDAYDVACMISEVIVAGGVRRSACIALFDQDDGLMWNAKTPEKLQHNPHRANANNSCYVEKSEDVEPEFLADLLMYCRTTGDPGLVIGENLRRKAVSAGRSPLVDYGMNPCAEIILQENQVCNLTEVVLRPEQSLEYNEEQVRAATFLGLLQAQLTDFNLRFLMRTTDITRKEPLLGVSLTGLMDDPVFTDGGCEALDYLRSVAHEEVQWWCALMDWRVPLAITTVKPSGSVSKLCGSSAGIHQRYSDYYLMNVVVPREYPLATFLRDQGVPIRYVSDRGVMFSFPTKTQEDSRGTNVLQQLERWRRVNNTWADHSVSCTIYVRQEDEWDDLCLWLLKHRDEVTGLSFMGEFAGVPGLPMPLEKLTKERYEELMETFPQELDWDAFGKHYDDTSKVTYDIERACDGDKCDVKF